MNQKWAIFDSLYCPEQFTFSHLDSYATYLRLMGAQVAQVCWNFQHVPPAWDFVGEPDVSFFLDRYEAARSTAGKIKVAQVAARCSTMPWEVRDVSGKHVYSLVLSSIPAIVDEARAEGCRAEYMPLAFDVRVRAATMGVKRTRDCVFIGTRGSNHRYREQVLHELDGIVEVLPPVFGADYYRALASARVIISPHAEWSCGAANNMRLYESVGVGASVVYDGLFPEEHGSAFGWSVNDFDRNWRETVKFALERTDLLDNDTGEVLTNHCYENRIPALVSLVRSL